MFSTWSRHRDAAMQRPYEWTRVTWDGAGAKQMHRTKTIRIPVRRAKNTQRLIRTMLCLLGSLSLSLAWLFHCSGECSSTTLDLISLNTLSSPTPGKSPENLPAKVHTDGIENRPFANGKAMLILTPRTSFPTRETSDTTTPHPADGYAQRILRQSTRDPSTIKVLK